MGYRWFDKQKTELLYPFGYGLSYTTFEYDKLELEPGDDFSLTVEFKVKNTGKMKASEVCQLYVHDVVSGLDRPLQELKGFSKIDLEPGEEKLVRMQLEKDAFSFYHPERRKWQAEKGDFEIRVGTHSRKIFLKESFTLH